MTIRESAIAKLQQLPESLLQQVIDFIDFLTYKRYRHTAAEEPQNIHISTWKKWFKGVDDLAVSSTESVGDYQQHLLSKYRKQGLEL